MTDIKNTASDTAHVEVHHDTQSQTAISDDDVASKALDSDELHEQMTAQVKATRLSWRSKASLQLWAMLFVAYCSKFSAPNILPQVEIGVDMTSSQTRGGPDLTAH